MFANSGGSGSTGRRLPTAVSLFVLAVVLVGCNADLAILVTPLSAELFDEEQIRRAEEAGAGRVILIAPAGEERRGFLRPGVGPETSILVMPDVGDEAASEVRGGERLFLELRLPEARRGGESGAAEERAREDRRTLYLDRRSGYRRVGELVTAYVENRLENGGESAETITVRLFLLQGSEERLAEGRALLEPMRAVLPAERILLEEVNPGFGVDAIRRRAGEAGPGDPLLFLLGPPGVEAALQFVGVAGPVVTESLLLPSGGAEAEELSAGTLYIVGVDPAELLTRAEAGREGAVETSVFRYGEGLPGALSR